MSENPRFRHILVGSAWLGLGEGCTRLANFLIVILVAQTRGPEGLGVFAIGQLIGNYLLLGTDFGYKTAGARLVSLHHSWTRSLIRAIQRRRAILSALLFPAGLCYAFLGPIPEEARLFVAGFSLSVLPQALTLDWTLLGLERYALLGMLRAGVALLFAAASAAILLAGGDLSSVAVANGASTLVGALAVWALWFRRSEYRAIATLTPSDEEQVRQETRWRTIAWLGLATIFVQMFQTIDTLMLGGFVPVDDVGRYNGAHKLVVLTFGVYYLFTQAMLPKLARMTASGASNVLRWTVALAAVGAVGALAISALAEPLIRVVYGEAMSDAALILRWLVWTMPGEFALAFMGTALVAWGRERLMLVIAGGALALNAVLNILVIPDLGILGAAQVKLVSYAVVVLALAAAVKGTPLMQRISEKLNRGRI